MNMSNPYLPPGVSDEMMGRRSKEHVPETCEEGNNGDRCVECEVELAERKRD